MPRIIYEQNRKIINTLHQCFPANISAYGSSSSWGHQRRTLARYFGPSPPYTVLPRRDHSTWSPLTAGAD